MKILVTGSAGFIGFHFVERLAQMADTDITGIDNLNSYYDIGLKQARLQQSGIDTTRLHPGTSERSTRYPNYVFRQIDLTDADALRQLFDAEPFDVVINLAAQAGVRYSVEHPAVYVQSNIVGFTHLLECCRYNRVKHLIYASSSSVYGAGSLPPFTETANTDHPLSIYAATKKSNELLAHAYSHLFHLPTTGVRLFTVYGPWGRPDMAPMLFADAILNSRPIRVFNGGNMYRDFTYVDDIVSGIMTLIDRPPGQDNPTPYYRLLNIGHSQPVALMDFIRLLEKHLDRKATLEMLPMQPGDVLTTCADTDLLEALTGYCPQTPIEVGVKFFVDWFKSYYANRADK